MQTTGKFENLLLIVSCLFYGGYASVTLEDEGSAGDLLQYRNGDIILAGLMRVHRRGGGELCSEIQEDGIQAVETMNMIIDQVNANSSILKGINLGTLMVDTCDVDSHALKRVVTDILPIIWNLGAQPSANRPHNMSTLLAGVVGSASSAVSIQVANILQVFEIPQVSYWSTSPDLSNKARYKYFFRTVPSDSNQAKAMIAIVRELGWNYVSVVYEDDFYGVRGFTEIKDVAITYNICVAVSQAVPRNPTEKDFQNIIEELLTKDAKAVIVFTKRNDAANLMIAAHNTGGPAKDLIWIGSDGWSGQIPREDDGSTLDATVHGSIGFTPKTGHIKEFHDYFTSIRLDKYKGEGRFRNPWFAEYISQKKKCNVDEGYGTDLEATYDRYCDEDERVSEQGFLHLTKMQSVADAVLSFVYALDQYHRKICKGLPGMCKELSDMSGTKKLALGIYSYLKNLSFQGINGDKVSFDENQDGPALYNILSYQNQTHNEVKKRTSSSLENWLEIGTFAEGKVDLKQPLSMKVQDTASVCSKPCEEGEATITGTDACCWICQPCQTTQYVASNKTMCIDCGLGYTPNMNQTDCDALPIEEMRYDSVYSTVCICLGAFGLVCTIIVTGIYIKYRCTAIVKASGRELCFFVLFGIFVTFFNCVSMTSPTSVLSCAVSRILLAIGPACMYAGLLVKTVRVVIIFQSKKILSERVKTFIRPFPQIACTLGVVFIQALVLIIWFTVNPPEAVLKYPNPQSVFRACRYLVDIPILIGLIYPFLLIIICTVLATVNRNVPTGFNETQYIGFSMYTTCVIWLAFLPIFVTNSTDIGQRIMTTSICLSLSATTVLFCLFGPRCFNILFHPETNTSQSVMSSTRNPNSSTDIGGVPGSLAKHTTSTFSAMSRPLPEAREYNINNNSNNNNCNNNKYRQREDGKAKSPNGYTSQARRIEKRKRTSQGISNGVFFGSHFSTDVHAFTGKSGEEKL